MTATTCGYYRTSSRVTAQADYHALDLAGALKTER